MGWLADNFTPMWIVWFCVIAVVCVVIGTIFYKRKPGESLHDTVGASPLTLLGATLVATSFLSLLGFSSPTVVDWWQALAVRMAWQMGGVVVLEIGILLDAKNGGSLDERPVWILIGVFFAIGVALTWNTARDLIDGPVVLRGHADLAVEKTHGRHASIAASITLKAPDGSDVPFDFAGWGAEDAEDKFSECDPKSEVDVTVLRHTERVLDVACK